MRSGTLLGFSMAVLAISAVALAAPAPTGRLVAVGDGVIHLDCRGTGRPTVVVEAGLGDFSLDWTLVQERVARVTRICTWDRPGYAWSSAGPFPRTFDQINFDLERTLDAAMEQGPFILVGHSFGGPVVRNFAKRYPALVAGMVLVDGVHENQRVSVAGNAVRLRAGATGRAIPEPRLHGRTPAAATTSPGDGRTAIDERLPPQIRTLHRWAASQPDLQRTEESQREWSAETFEDWYQHPQAGLLGSKPLIVLARNMRTAGDADPVAVERALLQLSLVELSGNAMVVFAGFDHEMHLAIPAVVANAITLVIRAAREQIPLAEVSVDDARLRSARAFARPRRETAHRSP